jgi:ORF6N domain
MFELTAEEFTDLRLQSATSSAGHGGRRYAPLAFTEHGAIMASMVLGSERATALSVYVVRAFVELRALIGSNKELAAKVHAMERKVSVHERSIAQLADAMTELLAAPPTALKRPIGFITPEDKGSSRAGSRKTAGARSK